MNKLTRQNFPESTELFLDILVETNNANKYYLGLVTDFIVQKVSLLPG
jgi:hypothetical protein